MKQLPKPLELKKLFEILVPTIYGDTLKPIRTRHHKRWDEMVRKVSNGLTLMTPAKGQWLFEGALFEERVIPVRIACTDTEMDKIVQFSLRHYRQKAIMYYVLSIDCRTVYANS